MKLDDLRSVDQLRDFLEGTQAVAFTVVTNKDERYQWMQRTLIRFGYRQLSKADNGIVIRYRIKISGYSRQQVSRLIGQYVHCGRLRRRQRTVRGFQRHYTDEDVALLVEVDRLHGTANGLAVKKLFERAWRVHGDQRYRRLAGISVSHIYNLRKSKGYKAGAQHTSRPVLTRSELVSVASLSPRVIRAICASTRCIRVTGMDTKVSILSMQ